MSILEVKDGDWKSGLILHGTEIKLNLIEFVVLIQFSKVIEENAKNVVWDIGWPCDEKNIRSEIYIALVQHIVMVPGPKMTKHV